MKQSRTQRWRRILAQNVLVNFPTIFIIGYLLKYCNSSFSILENNWINQTIIFATALISGTIVYSFRLRFITTILLLVGILYLVYSGLGKFNSGEFDSFYFSVKFLIFSYLFTAGCIISYGFYSSKYFPVFWAVLILSLQIIIASKLSVVSAQQIILMYAPVLVYAVYILYTCELLRNIAEENHNYVLYLSKRIGGFFLFAIVLISILLLLFQKEFTSIEKEWAENQGSSSNGKESMTKNNKDGTIQNNDQMKITGSLSKDKRLVFVAHLDNYFPDGKTPNPLYFTSMYYTKFDESTQTFETDTALPKNDLFSPDPSKIPLYFTQTDSSVLTNSMSTRERKIVTADVYKVILSPQEFVAPSTSFYCQPIPVENEYKQQFKSAYKAKMYVSNLNSAYFVYNPAGNQQLEAFQNLRYDALRKAGSYETVDKSFMQYYTYMPKDEAYNKISVLAKDVTKNAKTPVDKMIAIRDYFTGKDELGQPLFRYSDNPGIPGLPSASKLNYFLFENRKGYCAYFAGATLFMLRSLGLPSRIVAGFLTVDRSTKNPGWYWFYADQAHAWVQLFFPGYGWIDFDTTIPDLNTQQSSQPDGTPPMNIQQPLFVADGQAITVDTINKKVTMLVKKMLFHDKDIAAYHPDSLLIDVSMATVTKDTGICTLSNIKPGNNIVSVSYAESLKNITTNDDDNISTIVQKLPAPVPIDEVKLMETEDEKRAKAAKQIKKTNKSYSWQKFVWALLAILATMFTLLLLLPSIVFIYLNQKVQSNNEVKNRTFNIYRAVLFYLHQMGEIRINESPEQFAKRMDEKYSTQFHQFMIVYQKLKYSKTVLSKEEAVSVSVFYSKMITQVKGYYSLKERLKAFLQFSRTINFIIKP